MELGYCGEDFFGWQVQPDRRSVQGEIQSALGILLKEAVDVVGAGRTDTGVSALRYTAHFDARAPFDCADLCYRLNSILPKSIVIHSIEPTTETFHARFNATLREYEYHIHRRKDPFCERFSYLCPWPELDFDAMNRAASRIVGTRDFSCFEKKGADNKTSICTVHKAIWIMEDDNHWTFRISADRFLRNMVRAIVGTLLETGRGKRTEEDMSALLESGDRCLGGESVPGHALFLTRVEYP